MGLNVQLLLVCYITTKQLCKIIYFPVWYLLLKCYFQLRLVYLTKLQNLNKIPKKMINFCVVLQPKIARILHKLCFLYFALETLQKDPFTRYFHRWLKSLFTQLFFRIRGDSLRQINPLVNFKVQLHPFYGVCDKLELFHLLSHENQLHFLVKNMSLGPILMKL